MTTRHVPALDGVRGVAVLAVLLHHGFAAEPFVGWAALLALPVRAGWMGVDLFFVLSGFLITRILIETRGAPGWRRSFYLRRALRIWPLYVAVLLALTGVALAWPALGGGQAARFLSMALWYWTHTLNLGLALGAVPAPPYFTFTFWSLGVEEQFYLVWPFVVAAIAPARLTRVCLLLAAASVAVRAAGVAAGHPPGRLFVAPWSHLDGLALGAALAGVIAVRGTLPAWAVRARDVLAGTAWRASVTVAGGVVLALAIDPSLSPSQHGLAMLAGPLIAALLGVLLIAAALGPTPTARALSVAPLRAVGRVSYGLYLLHGPALAVAELVAERGGHDASRGGVVLIAYAATFALAWASWRWWEAPWLRLKRYVPRPQASPAAADASPAAA